MTIITMHCVVVYPKKIKITKITLDKLEQNHSSTSFFRYFSLKFNKITLDKLELNPSNPQQAWGGGALLGTGGFGWGE